MSASTTAPRVRRRRPGVAGPHERSFDREDRFLQAFNAGLDELAAVVVPAYRQKSQWVARIRAGLGALLACLDREPALGRLVFVEALGAGPRVQERRAQVLEILYTAVDGGRATVKVKAERVSVLSSLTAESGVTVACGVIYARLLQPGPSSLTELLNPLMATIVLPYRGQVAAARELSRPSLSHTNRGALVPSDSLEER